jgi:hypothetical protein
MAGVSVRLLGEGLGLASVGGLLFLLLFDLFLCYHGVGF